MCLVMGVFPNDDRQAIFGTLSDLGVDFETVGMRRSLGDSFLSLGSGLLK